MKANIPHPFFIYASRFSLKSMLIQIAFWSQYTMKNQQEAFGMFARKENFKIMDGKREIKGQTFLVQTWLIDIIYHLICSGYNGSAEMDSQQALYLISLYNNYADNLDAECLNKKVDPILYAMGFFGEQHRFQNASIMFEEFSREKYILDEISYQTPKEYTYGIDVKNEFLQETGFSTDDYSAICLIIWYYFSYNAICIKDSGIVIESHTPIINKDKFLNILSRYTITIDEIRKSSLKRQVLYTKPIIKIDDEYLTTNPFLLLSVFSSSNYWVLRNKYFRQKSTNFINAFGYYFETYVKEVISNCLENSMFERIQEDDSEKRADWYLKLGNYDVLVEQKSSLSLLGIKQSHPDMQAMKKHITTNWSEAIQQLKATQKHYKLTNPIKIILVYEDYYTSKCLDQLFLLDKELDNDHKYWLLSITEFENLLHLYKTNPNLALDIIKEKDLTEINKVNDIRDLKQFFSKHGIEHNQYLCDTGIYEGEFERIKNMCTYEKE